MNSPDHLKAADDPPPRQAPRTRKPLVVLKQRGHQYAQDEATMRRNAQTLMRIVDRAIQMD